MNPKDPRPCPDCDGFSRRDFLKGLGVGAAAAAAGTAPLFALPRAAAAAVSGPKSGDVTMVGQLYRTLTPEQKKAVCFGWDDQKRQMVNNNWMIVPQKIGEFYTPEQQELITGIFKSA